MGARSGDGESIEAASRGVVSYCITSCRAASRAARSSGVVDQLVTRRMTVRPSPSFSQVLKRMRSASAFDLGLFQNHELLIGGAFAEEGAPGLAQDAAQLVGGCDGHTSHFAVQVIGEQRVELHAEQTPPWPAGRRAAWRG